MLKVKRAYVPAEPSDGFRILVDRLWPQGESKAKEQLGLWAKDIAPSTGLRQALHGGEIDFEQFADSYRRELNINPHFKDFEDTVAKKLHQGSVTLVYASKNEKENNAVVLMEALEDDLKFQNAA